MQGTMNLNRVVPQVQHRAADDLRMNHAVAEEVIIAVMTGDRQHQHLPRVLMSVVRKERLSQIEPEHQLQVIIIAVSHRIFRNNTGDQTAPAKHPLAAQFERERREKARTTGGPRRRTHY